jgi:hypothetical protein
MKTRNPERNYELGYICLDTSVSAIYGYQRVEHRLQVDHIALRAISEVRI